MLLKRVKFLLFGSKWANLATLAWKTNYSSLWLHGASPMSKTGKRKTRSNWTHDQTNKAVIYWTHDRTKKAVICRFGEVVQHSGPWGFLSGALYREVSHQWRNDRAVGHNGLGAESPGRRKVPTMSYVFSSIHYIYSQKTSGSNMGAPNSFCAPGVI